VECGRVICATLDNGFTWQEVEKAADDRCGVKERRKATSCEDELAKAKVRVKALEDEVTRLDQEHTHLVDLVGTQNAQIQLANQRVQTLAVALGALLAVFGLAKLGRSALAIKKALRSSKDPAKVLDDAIQETAEHAAKTREILAKIVKEAATIERSTATIANATVRRQPLTIEIIGGTKGAP
jgi:predicted  nucleic acid-binding Zn-ribbon protein